MTDDAHSSVGSSAAGMPDPGGDGRPRCLLGVGVAMKIAGVEISSTRIADLMTTAIESGFSDYWCRRVWLVVGEVDKSTGDPWYAQASLYDNPFELSVEEADEDGDCVEKHGVTDSSIADGLTLMATKFGQHWADFVAENEDAITADVFLQCVALGDVVYG